MASRAENPVSRLVLLAAHNCRAIHLRRCFIAPEAGSLRTLPGSCGMLLWAICLLLALLPIALRAQATPRRFVVVLDAAHGGDDAGATLTGQPNHPEAEKDYTLALSVRLRSLLAARGIVVVTTREADISVDAQHRAELANRAQAQACLVLHAADTGSGVHLFLSSLPPAQPERLAPWMTAQAAWVTRGVALAGVLNSALLHAGMKTTLGRTALPVIDSMTCPAVAVEIAPDAKEDGGTTPLDDPGYQARIADALAAGLLEWRAEPQQP